jgi:hypothetical protein
VAASQTANTSKNTCATESNNAAIAAALKASPSKRHIVTSQVEHSSVLNYCMALEKENCSEPSFPPQPSFPRKRESTPSPEEMDPRFRGGDNEVPPPFPHTPSFPPPGHSREGGNPEGRLQRESTAVRVTYLPVDRDGLLKLADLEAAITDQTAVVSLMWANNEFLSSR